MTAIAIIVILFMAASLAKHYTTKTLIP